MEVNSSGADEPAAIKVAPATSSDRSNFSLIASNDGTKKSSQMIASATNEKETCLCKFKIVKFEVMRKSIFHLQI